MEKTWKLKEIADFLSVGVGTIRNRAKQLNITYVYDDSDKIKTNRITNDDVVKLFNLSTENWYPARIENIKKRMIADGVIFDRPAQKEPKEEIEIKEQTKEEPAKKSDKKDTDLTQSILDFKAEIEKEKNAVISSLNKEIDQLKEQISKQEEQIQDLKNDKENLNQTITDLTKLLDQQQQLNLNQQQLIEHTAKSWWQRLWRK